MRGLVVAVTVVVLATPAAAAAPAAAQDAACVVPNALRDAGEKEAARRVYRRLLTEDPKLACARAQLKTLNAAATPADAAADLCEQGAAYRRVGRDDDAEAAYKKALAKDASDGSCGEQGLTAVNGSWHARTSRLLAALPRAAALAGLLLAACFGLLLLGYVPVVSRLYRRTPAWAMLRPRLTLTDLTDRSDDDKAGAAVTARIRERLQRFRQETEDEAAFADNLDFGTSTQELADIVSGDTGLEKSLENLGKMGGQTGAAAALIGLVVGLLPVRRFSVHGIIEPASGPSASATLALQCGSRLRGAVTLTGRDLDHEPAAGDYLALAAPAAVWLQYEIARSLARVPRSPETAESYALVREGLDHHVDGDLAAAVTAFEQAVALDPENWSAQVNLAVTTARLAKDFRTAEAILVQAVEDFQLAYP